MLVWPQFSIEIKCWICYNLTVVNDAFGKMSEEMTDLSTKDKFIEAAIELFSEKGYGNVYVGQIAEGVGIKAPSLYKHYKRRYFGKF